MKYEHISGVDSAHRCMSSSLRRGGTPALSTMGKKARSAFDLKSFLKRNWLLIATIVSVLLAVPRCIRADTLHAERHATHGALINGPERQYLMSTALAGMHYCDSTAVSISEEAASLSYQNQKARPNFSQLG
ncbi:hypothetical protein JZ751_024185 [Albula glossodonta]|uniref:Uncharacterized protein n=1 Tax=Albula glossodonta TaxID=121402 RepID=A0A8T2NF53_9TELE|nr:hypothetical protein JZ751_024185 [Albula glossodonta]